MSAAPTTGKDLTTVAWTFFAKRNGITPKVYLGRNVTQETLTYMTPSSRADKITEEMMSFLPSSPGKTVRVHVIEPCGGSGGNTVSFLSHKNVRMTSSYERFEDRSLMLKRNIMAYELGTRALVYDKEFMPDDVDAAYAGCVMYFDPPWLPDDIKGHLSTKDQYLKPGNIRIGGWTPEEYMEGYADIAYMMTWQFPPTFADETFGAKNPDPKASDRDSVVKGWKVVRNLVMAYGGASVKSVVFHFINQNKAVRAACLKSGGVPDDFEGYLQDCESGKGECQFLAGSFEDDEPSADDVLINVEPPARDYAASAKPAAGMRPHTHQGPVRGGLVGGVSKRSSDVRDSSDAIADTFAENLSLKEPSPKKLPGLPPRSSEKTRGTIGPRGAGAAAGGAGTRDIPDRHKFSVSLTKYTGSLPSRSSKETDSAEWVEDLREYIYQVLAMFIEDKKHIASLLTTPEQMNVWLRAFTHEAYSPDTKNNYESLETLGDAMMGYVFKSYLLRRFPDITTGQLSEFKAQYLGKGPLSQLSGSLRLAEWCRVPDMIDASDYISVREDLVESFVGALVAVGDMVRPGFGCVLAYNMVEFVYRDVEFDMSVSIGTAITVITQQFSTPFRLPAPTIATSMRANGTYDSTITASREWTNFYRENGYTVDEILATGKGTSKKASEGTAWEAALRKLASAGITVEMAQKLKKANTFSNISKKQFEEMQAKATRAGVRDLQYYSPRGLTTDSSSLVQLIGTGPEGRVILATAKAATEEEARKRVVELYLV